jgi:putative membrane protein insertion efficiency factor
LPDGSDGVPPSRRISSFAVLTIALASALAGDAFNPPARQWSARAAASSILAYRESVSPLLARTGWIRCRFTPTCSSYGLDAVRRHGFFPGMALAGWRVLRCNPLSKGGFDPIP